ADRTAAMLELQNHGLGTFTACFRDPDFGSIAEVTRIRKDEGVFSHSSRIETRLLTMKPKERVLYDLTITDRPKKPLIITPDTKADQIDAIDVYSASYEWLVQFRDFIRASGGFEVS